MLVHYTVRWSVTGSLNGQSFELQGVPKIIVHSDFLTPFFLYNLFNIPGSPRGSRIKVNNLRPIRVNKLVVEYM